MKIWLLWYAPGTTLGRVGLSAGLFSVLLAVFWSSGIFTIYRDESSWAAALFFCVSVAYIVPIFQFITGRTEEAFDALRPVLDFTPTEFQQLRRRISHRRPTWFVVNTAIAVVAWLVQSWFLAGGWERMVGSLTRSYVSAVMATGPLLVWLSLTCAVHALVDNARLFRALARRVRVEVLNGAALNPIGRMAVSSTLVVVGAQAAFPLMWLGPQDLWTTVPGLIGTAIPLVFLLLAPVWPVHLALREAKRSYLAEIQAKINAADAANHAVLAPLLAVRREVVSTPEWPFDLGIVARLGLYLFIVPLTWVGAALIEMMVEVFVG